jgi:hypothetical protein
MTDTNATVNALISACSEMFGTSTVTNKQLKEAATQAGVSFWPILKNKEQYLIKRGVYDLTLTQSKSKPSAFSKPMAASPAAPTAAVAPQRVNLSIETNSFTENLIPEKDELFVPFGNFSMLKKIIQSDMFYPVFVTGMSGNGKTFGIEQACAQTKREVIRVNFTVETDEDDLIGGFRLIEKKIVGRVFESLGVKDTQFVSKLVDWADIVRKTFLDGGVDEIISTRRLVHVAKAYSIFGDKMQAIDLCINRFDEETKLSFRDLYTKLDADVVEENNSENGDESSF